MRVQVQRNASADDKCHLQKRLLHIHRQANAKENHGQRNCGPLQRLPSVPTNPAQTSQDTVSQRISRASAVSCDWWTELKPEEGPFLRSRLRGSLLCKSLLFVQSPLACSLRRCHLWLRRRAHFRSDLGWRLRCWHRSKLSPLQAGTLLSTPCAVQQASAQRRHT